MRDAISLFVIFLLSDSTLHAVEGQADVPGTARISCSNQSLAEESNKLDQCQTVYTVDTRNSANSITAATFLCCKKGTFCCGKPEEHCCPTGYACAANNKCLSPRSSATCTAWGDPHYTTFDGAKMDYMGMCKHILAQSNASGVVPFVIYGKNYKLNPSESVSYMGMLELYYKGKVYRLERDANKKPQVKVYVGQSPIGTQINMKTDGLVVNNLPYNQDGVKITRVAGSEVVVLQTDNNITMSYDGICDPKIHIPGAYFNKVNGMCGNFDDNRANDMSLNTGVRSSNPTAIGNSYTVPDPEADPKQKCTVADSPKGQEADPQMKALIQQACKTIMDSNGPLGNCTLALGPDKLQGLYEGCSFDGVTAGYSTVCNSYKITASMCQDVTKKSDIISSESCYFESYAVLIGGSSRLTYDGYPIFSQSPGYYVLSKPTTACNFPYFEIRQDTNKDFIDYNVNYAIEILYANQRIQVIRNDKADEKTEPAFSVYVSKASDADMKSSSLPIDQQKNYEPSGLDNKGLGTPVKDMCSTAPYKTDDYIIICKGLSVVVTLKNGVKCVIERRFTNIFAPREYQGKLQGLLGNYDKDPSNDDVLPTGKDAVSPNVNTQLEEAWRIYRKNYPSGTTSTGDKSVKSANSTVCRRLVNPNGIFKECLQIGAILKKTVLYHEVCNYAASYDLYQDNGACTTLAAFSGVCAQYGYIIEWQNTCGCNVGPETKPKETFQIPPIVSIPFTFPEFPKIPPLPPFPEIKIPPIPPFPSIPPFEMPKMPVFTMPDLGKLFPSTAPGGQPGNSPASFSTCTKCKQKK